MKLLNGSFEAVWEVIRRAVLSDMKGRLTSAKAALDDLGEAAFIAGMAATTQALEEANVAERYRPEAEKGMVTAKAVVDFLADRLKVQQREAGVRHDLIDAVFALGGEDDLVRLLARVKALQAFMATEDGTNLLAGYKRAANILKQAGEVSGTAAATPPTDADAALLAALDAAEPAASAAVADERFTDAMAALASLRAPIDAFFDGVMVNDPDEAIRKYRLGLLSRFTGAVHGVADFSKIEG
jgi:glycyl-tRNA synthetase beta chain